jgi:hypothetical protein
MLRSDRMSKSSLLFAAALLCASLSALCCPAGAVPLDKQACADLALERQGLVALKVEDLMAKGADWAAAHLSLGDLNLVRRFIEVDEQIKFRCEPATTLVKLRGLDDEEDDEVGGGDQSAEAEANAKGADAKPVHAPPLPRKR